MSTETSNLSAQTEKPHHYSYLKEFRTQQCPLFLQHKCTQHRPFTCFHWHFMNQRRRRPIRRKDGTFNYSPDHYCTKYDETTGICPDGDDCVFLHRTAGDTERRYHLRYYKTSVCVHETDTKGQCVKNGPHCAFAHGASDLRPPVYDIRELQDSSDRTFLLLESPLASSVEKEKLINDDPRWNDTAFVLLNYKTEGCKRPPRLCRQGYACPSYHNNRDRRRSPKTCSYRSTPCPNVKHGDDWGDPALCESGDSCKYCHTRTEQQFHPEIYKSTKCNDMVQTGYCPRGPFCAFAHVEQEMTHHRDLHLHSDTSLAAFVASVLPPDKDKNHNGLGKPLDLSRSLPTSSPPIWSEPPPPLSESFTESRLFLSRAPGSERERNGRTYYQTTGDTVQSVLGNALDDDDFDIGELNLSLDRELGPDPDEFSSYTSRGLLNSSVPVTIPSPRSSSSALSSSPFLSTLFPLLPSVAEDSPLGSPLTSPEEERLRSEVAALKKKMAVWERSVNQARQACQAWQATVEDTTTKNRLLQQEIVRVSQQRDEVLQQLDDFRSFLHCVQKMSELEFVPLPHLKQLQAQLKLDMDTLDKVVHQHGSLLCSRCNLHTRLPLSPCQHYVLCETCSLSTQECPVCHHKLQRT